MDSIQSNKEALKKHNPVETEMPTFFFSFSYLNLTTAGLYFFNAFIHWSFQKMKASFFVKNCSFFDLCKSRDKKEVGALNR